MPTKGPHNVVKIYPRGAKDPDAVLEQAVGVYQDLIIIGYDHEGWLEVRSTTTWEERDILCAVQRFMHKLLSGDYNE